MAEKQKIKQLKDKVLRQQENLMRLEEEKQASKKMLMQQSIQWHEAKQNYENNLSLHEISHKKSAAVQFLKQRFYGEGILQKFQKINNEIESITSRSLERSRNCISKYGQVDYKRIIMAEKNQKQKQEEQRLLGQIKSLEKELKFGQNTIAEMGQL